jgi:glycosyltransferase involved in cell wall biosynthesis
MSYTVDQIVAPNTKQIVRTRVAIVFSPGDRPEVNTWLFESSLAETHELIFIYLAPTPGPFEEAFRSKGFPVYFVPYSGKRDLPLTTLRLVHLFRALRPQVVHTHLVDASLSGLTAAMLCGIKHRIHTRHHSNNFQFQHRHALLYDRYVNFLSHKIIATCVNSKNVLETLDGVSEKKIQIVYYALDLRGLESVPEKAIDEIRKKYSLNNRYPVVLMASRYVEYKGLPHAIEAFEGLLQDFPSACLVLANASDTPHRKTIQSRLETLPRSSYVEFLHEPNIPALYKASDIFVHVPIDPVCEAFGQVYVEALVAGTPSIFTLSGVAPEFVIHERNCLVVEFQNSEAIRKSLVRLATDHSLRNRISIQGKKDVLALPLSFEAHAEGLRNAYAVD